MADINLWKGDKCVTVYILLVHILNELVEKLLVD